MKMLIIGWFGAGNMGDEAILFSELLSLRRGIEETEFYILSFSPEKTRRLTADIPEVRKILRMGSKHNVVKTELLGLLKAFKEVDVVIIGGGGIFQDIYNFYPIPFFTAMAFLARCYKKLLMLYCVGIGPVNTFLGKRLCSLAANLADVISVRDSMSKELLEGFGVTKEICLSADPVFQLEPVYNERVEEVIKDYSLEGDRPVIGVCVQDLFDWGNENRKILADVLDKLSIEKEAKIVFIPLGMYKDGWFKENTDTVDAAASKRLAGFMKREYAIMTDDLSPRELLSVMVKMTLIISMRLHGVIMGLVANVPVIALTYKKESKVRQLMKKIGQTDNLFDVCNIEKLRLLNRMDYLLSERDSVRAEIKNTVSLLHAEADKSNELLFNRLI